MFLFDRETVSALDVPATEILDLSFEKRVHEVAKACEVKSPVVTRVLRNLGYNVKSASSKVRFEPFEYDAIMTVIEDEVF